VRSVTFLAPALFTIPPNLQGAAKRNTSGASGSWRGTPANRSITSVIVEKKGLASFGPQTTNDTYPFSTITLSASRTAVAGSTKKNSDKLPTTASKVQSTKSRVLAEKFLKRIVVQCLLRAP